MYVFIPIISELTLLYIFQIFINNFKNTKLIQSQLELCYALCLKLNLGHKFKSEKQFKIYI